jgi:orotate phosphoribosyltransferase
MLTAMESARTTDAAARRDRLLALLHAQALISGRQTRLASGRTSALYFDMKVPMFEPEAINLIAEEILAVLRHLGANSIGGLELGAVPIISAVVCRSFPDYPVTGFLVRKSVKEYGTQKKIEGNFDAGARIVMLDDVTTTGGSVLDAVRVVRAAGGTVERVVTIVDREEGAAANLAAEGLALHALFTKSDFST